MKFKGRRKPQDADAVTPASFRSAYRPLRGGPIPVSQADLPFYAALVGRNPTADDRTAVFVSEFAQAEGPPAADGPAWRRVATRVRQIFTPRRAG